MQNTFLQNVEYKVENTALGTWRRFGYPTGQSFHEFTSHRTILGLPLLHYPSGRCPETGRRKVARGVVAIGRLAFGVVAIGHASAGVVAIGQAGLGLALGIGQATTGVFALGQVALALVLGIGQIATGHAAVGQLAVGDFVLAQKGVGRHVWDTQQIDPEARAFFEPCVGLFRD